MKPKLKDDYFLVISSRHATCTHPRVSHLLRILSFNCVCGVGMYMDQQQWEWSHVKKWQTGREKVRGLWPCHAFARGRFYSRPHLSVPALLSLPRFSPLHAHFHFRLRLNPTALHFLLLIFISSLSKEESKAAKQIHPVKRKTSSTLISNISFSSATFNHFYI